MTIEHEHTHVGADHQGSLVRLNWWHHDEMGEDGHPVMHESLVDPDDAIQLAHNLITAAHASMQAQRNNALAGECKRCRNLRMIDKKKPGGHTERIHCPVCYPKIHGPIATIEPRRDDEARVLRRPKGALPK